MSEGLISISEDRIDEIRTLLSEMGGSKVNAALANAANRALTTARSEAWNAVKQIYTIKRTDFYDEVKTKLYRANKSAVGATLEFRGYVIPLVNFKVSSYRSHERSSVRRMKVSVFKGAEETLRHAYRANLGRYGDAVFERATPRRNTSEQLYGPSAAHMVYNADVLDHMSEKAAETFEKRLDHEIDRILRGIGI